MAVDSPISAFLNQQGFLVLDGGLATELESRGHDLSSGLWSAHLLMTNTDAIRDVHLDYLEAGADCIITASYQASIPGFKAMGISEKKAKNLIQESVRIACDVRDEFFLNSGEHNRRIRPIVAASIGPYGAFLANGAEYEGNYSVSKDDLLSFHEPRWEILENSNADILVCETIPSIEEAEVLLNLINKATEKYILFSFSCRDAGHISDGTAIKECAEILGSNNRVAAIGINCTAPRYISSLITEIQKGNKEKLIAVYPNSGEVYDGKLRKWIGTENPVNFGSASVEWFKKGAMILGGCCRTGLNHIRMIKDALVKYESSMKAENGKIKPS